MRRYPLGGARQAQVHYAALRRSGVDSVWFWAALLVVVYGAIGLAGTTTVLNEVFGDVLLWAATVACFAGALRASRSRAAWLLAATALTSWAIGDTLWSVRYAGDPHAPLTSVSDVFWLAWYPLILAALVLLLRDRVPRFELHRWIDGVVVMLLVVTPWVAAFLQPVAEHSRTSALADAVDFAYPLGDAVVVGSVLGAFALMGWRPGRMWAALGIGLGAIGIADAVYSVQALEQTYRGGVYDAAWIAGAFLVAYAAWSPRPERLQPRDLEGWSAIALALLAQMVAVTIQVYGLFHNIPPIERALTIVVLLMVMVQIVVTRPRRRPEAAPPVPASTQHESADDVRPDVVRRA
jgi:hypothetical protein